jgi:hypothetical protein
MKKIISLGIILGTPFFAFAVNDQIATILLQLTGYLTFFLPAIITIAIIYFVWGVVQFMTSADEEQKKLGRSKIINGLVGLFVIVTFWGLIAIVKTTFNINDTPVSTMPCTPLDTGRTIGNIVCP